MILITVELSVYTAKRRRVASSSSGFSDCPQTSGLMALMIVVCTWSSGALELFCKSGSSGPVLCPCFLVERRQVRNMAVLLSVWASLQFSWVCGPVYFSFGCVGLSTVLLGVWAGLLFSWVCGPVYCSLGCVGLPTVLLNLWACLLFSWVKGLWASLLLSWVCWPLYCCLGFVGLSTVLLGLWASLLLSWVCGPVYCSLYVGPV